MRGDEVIVRYTNGATTDAHGNAVPITATETVKNVLIMPGVAKDDIEAVRPYGVDISATLAFPKTYTRPLRGCEVYINAYKRWFRVVGDPLKVPHNCPTKWDYKVWVSDSDG